MNERRMWENLVRLLAKYKVVGLQINKDKLDIDAAEPNTAYPDREELVDYVVWGPSGQSCLFITDASDILGIYLVSPNGGKPDVILPQDIEGDERIPRFLKIGDFTKV